MTAEEAQRTQVNPLFGGGASAYYFKDFAEHPFEDYIKDITIPIMAIHGSNDYQVPADIDFALLRELFKGRDNVTLNLYDGLDHRFMASNATNFVEHRNQILGRAGARVDEKVLGDIVNWIKIN
jgi:dienelactone hydrolase